MEYQEKILLEILMLEGLDMIVLYHILYINQDIVQLRKKIKKIFAVIVEKKF